MIIDERNIENEYYVNIQDAEKTLLPVVLEIVGSKKIVINKVTRNIYVKTITPVQAITNGHIETTTDYKQIAPTRNTFTIYTSLVAYFSYLESGSIVRLTFKDRNLPKLQGYIERTKVYNNFPLESEIKIVFVGAVIEETERNQKEEKNNEKNVRKINRRFTF